MTQDEQNATLHYSKKVKIDKQNKLGKLTVSHIKTKEQMLDASWLISLNTDKRLGTKKNLVYCQ